MNTTTRVDAKEVTEGAKVNAVVTESRMPDKKAVIVTMAAAIVGTWMKWFEVHTGIQIPNALEVVIASFTMAFVSYITPERLSPISLFLGFKFKKFTMVDAVTLLSTGVITAAIKTYEGYFNTDVPAEQEFLIIPAFVGFCVSLVKTKNVEITSVKSVMNA